MYNIFIALYSRVIIIMGLLCTITPLGCSNDSSWSRKLSESIRLATAEQGRGSVISVNINMKLLSVLKSSNRLSLQHPIVVSCLIRRTKKTLLFVEWVEEHPSANKILIRESGTPDMVALSISDLYRKNNAHESKTGVVFTAGFDWENDSVPYGLNRALSGKASFEVALKRGDNEVSNWIPITVSVGNLVKSAPPGAKNMSRREIHELNSESVHAVDTGCVQYLIRRVVHSS